MPGNLGSSEVTAGSQATAAQYNALRDDILTNAGDYATAAGSAGAFTLTLSADLPTLAAGRVIKFKTNHTPTGACTVAVTGASAEGAKDLKKFKDGAIAALAQGDVVSGAILVAIYDGTQYLVVGGLQASGGLDGNLHDVRLPGWASLSARGSAFDETNGHVYILGVTQADITIHKYTVNNGRSVMNAVQDSATAYWKYTNSYGYATGICKMGDYLWLYASDTTGSNFKLLRITISDGTVQLMTISGTPPTSAFNGQIASDGTFLYLADSASTTVRKYSVSGTTATYVSAITMADKVGRNFMNDGTHFWFMTDDHDGSPTIANALYKCDSTGATVAYKKMIGLGSAYTFTGGPYNGQPHFLCEIAVGTQKELIWKYLDI